MIDNAFKLYYLRRDFCSFQTGQNAVHKLIINNLKLIIMKKKKTLSQLLLTVGLLFTGPLLMAQSAVFLPPLDPDGDFGIADVEIHRTGAGGCLFADHSLFVMTWDGDVPGFGWDLDDGDQTGFQELMADDPISHPDVVVHYYDDRPLAFIVYQMDRISGLRFGSTK